MNEEWKNVTIEPYSEKYEVSNLGRVRNAKTGMILKPSSDRLGYKHVTIQKTFSVHRLVAFAFLGEPPEGKNQVNHKDSNPANNHVDNLEWCSQKENNEHSCQVGNRSTAEYKEFLRDRMISRYQNPEFKKKMYDKVHGSTEWRNTISTKMKQRYEDPEFKKKVCDSLKAAMTPEVKKKHSDAMKEKNKDPEYRRRKSEGLKAAWARRKAK